MAFSTYTAQYYGARNHIALFVRPASADPNASGKCYHVTGTILAGINFEIRDRESPLVALDHVQDTMIRIGSVKKGDMARFEEICCSIPPLEAQLKLNGKPKDPSKLLRRCGDWVEEAVEKLKAESVLLEIRSDGDGTGAGATAGA